MKLSRKIAMFSATLNNLPKKVFIHHVTKTLDVGLSALPGEKSTLLCLVNFLLSVQMFENWETF
jgi:hypothetical protein